MASARIAIVGAGPAGFYAAEKLLKCEDHDLEVDMLDAVPTPWGLVRAGVAPDHPKIKGVSKVYEKVAALDGFRFHGNVRVGEDITHEELNEHFHAVVYAYGASGDRRLGIEGEDLDGVHAATEFVAWYNGHPDACDFSVDLSGRRAIVVGNGNVALDLARMLVLPREELERTDIADHALEALADSSIEEVVVLGRRGPAQAAFTTPELRELGDLSQADVVVEAEDAELDDASQDWLDNEARPTSKRNVDVITEYAQRGTGDKPRRVVLRFLSSPVECCGEGHVSAVKVARNELADEDGRLRARATDDVETLECSLVLRSVGYRGIGIDGVPFDEESGTILNEKGRVMDPESGEPLQGVYTTGWIKRGPSGVIGTNKKDSAETVACLLEDVEQLSEPDGDRDAFKTLLEERCPALVDQHGWQAIDAHEREAGEEQGRPRVKLTRREALVERGRARAEAPG